MTNKTIIVGAGWAGQEIASVLTHHNKQFNIVGFVDDQIEGNSVEIKNGTGMVNIPVIGKSTELSSIAEEHKADSIVMAITNNVKDHLLSDIVKCHENGLTVHQMPDLYSSLTKKVPIKHIDHRWVIPRLKSLNKNLSTIAIIVLDYFVSLMLAICTLPLFPLIALAIKLDSKGKVFFYQKRVGYNGKRFTLMKFRTMTTDARKTGAAWTTKEDKRITRLGKYMRKFRIDEWPQVINILKGDMMFIGPRPEAVELVQTFKKEIPFYEYRYLVKPGITGWAQVNHSNTCSVDGALEKLQYDLYWIKNRSIMINIKILFKSVKVCFTGFGAV